MFKIDEKPTFWTEVKIALPDEPVETFRARFNVVAASRLSSMSIHDLLIEALADAQGIEGADGKEIPYSSTLKDRLLDLPHVRTGLMLAYTDGVNKAAKGN